jgi:hypothetical protein
VSSDKLSNRRLTTTDADDIAGCTHPCSSTASVPQVLGGNWADRFICNVAPFASSESSWFPASHAAFGRHGAPQQEQR